MEVTLGLVSRWVEESNSDNSLNFLLFTEASLIREHLQARLRNLKTHNTSNHRRLIENVFPELVETQSKTTVWEVLCFFFPHSVKLLQAADGTGDPLLHPN